MLTHHLELVDSPAELAVVLLLLIDPLSTPFHIVFAHSIVYVKPGLAVIIRLIDLFLGTPRRLPHQDFRFETQNLELRSLWSPFSEYMLVSSLAAEG